MAYIYKITNKINNKIYIGKTLCNIQKRWKEHCKASHKEQCEKRPLYSAMNKYGIENFIIEQIEECSDEIVNEREVYWIEYYQSFKYGYNATKGGDGKHYLDYDLICETYNRTKNAVETAKLCGCSADSVRIILKNRKINCLSGPECSKNVNGKIINMYSKTGEYIKTFASIHDAWRYLVEHDGRSGSSGCSHIGQAANGKRKSAYGYIWKFTHDS